MDKCLQPENISSQKFPLSSVKTKSPRTKKLALLLFALPLVIPLCSCTEDDIAPKQDLLQHISAGGVKFKEDIFGCPVNCLCHRNEQGIITAVDCSNQDLKNIPTLPPTAVTVSLEKNFITRVSCSAFHELRVLKNLNLKRNNISEMAACVFQSQRKSLVNLKISWSELEELHPQMLKNMTSLKSLDVSVNKLTNLVPQIFEDLSSLEILDLSFNFLTFLGNFMFYGLHNLKKLYLQNNNLCYTACIDDLAFSGLWSLNTLDIKGNMDGDESINPHMALSVLTTLQELNMDAYSGSILGPGFRKLLSLNMLDLASIDYYLDYPSTYKSFSKCELNDLPENFFTNVLTNQIIFLNLGSCVLEGEVSSKAFSSFKYLIALIIDHNYMGQDTFLRLSESFVHLNISSMSMSAIFIMEEYGDFTRYLKDMKLKHLYMRGNFLDFDLASGKVHLPPTLDFLYVSHNSFFFKHLLAIMLSPSLKHLQTLKANKQIGNENCFNQENKHETSSSASVGIGGLKTEYDDPSFVPTMSVKHDTNQENKVSSHSVLDVTESSKKTIKTLRLAESLKVIEANSAQFGHREIPHLRFERNVLERAEFANNCLMSWFGPIENLDHLIYLDLSHNKCHFMDVNVFRNLTSLRTLLLQENFLSESIASDQYGQTFSTLVNLEILNLSSNAIDTLAYNAFINNVALNVLSLSDNKLVEFVPTLHNTFKMSRLDLSHNTLSGLSSQICEELKLLKRRNKNFTVNLHHNPLRFSCDFLPFLKLVSQRSDIFDNPQHLNFQLSNGSTIGFKEMISMLSQLEFLCEVKDFFIYVLISFFIVAGSVLFSAVIYYNRWKLRYLYHIGQRRMHVGDHVITYRPTTQVFITYDQDEPKWRRFLQQTFLPKLREANTSFIVGEVDFPSGNLMSHIAGAIVSTKKTVVLFSEEIFLDHYREIEVNLAILREVDTRCQIIVPVFVERVDLTTYPPEIETFLRYQEHRWLIYREDDSFWEEFFQAFARD